jgi:hypothetical protein
MMELPSPFQSQMTTGIVGDTTIASQQELQVQQKREVEKKQESTVPTVHLCR